MTSRPERKRSKRQFSILLVDDSSSILKALTRVFRGEGHKIYMATSATDALEILGHNEVDLIISDEMMPGTSGTELLQNVRNMYPNMIRIMLTGISSIEVAKDAINKGEVHRFFNKPWEDFELLVSVRHLLEKKAVEDENRRLKKLVEAQTNELNRLESEHPGITHVQLDKTGAIVMDER